MLDQRYPDLISYIIKQEADCLERINIIEKELPGLKEAIDSFDSFDSFIADLNLQNKRHFVYELPFLYENLLILSLSRLSIFQFIQCEKKGLFQFGEEIAFSSLMELFESVYFVFAKRFISPEFSLSYDEIENDIKNFNIPILGRSLSFTDIEFINKSLKFLGSRDTLLHIKFTGEYIDYIYGEIEVSFKWEKPVYIINKERMRSPGMFKSIVAGNSGKMIFIRKSAAIDILNRKYIGFQSGEIVKVTVNEYTAIIEKCRLEDEYVKLCLFHQLAAEEERARLHSDHALIINMIGDVYFSNIISVIKDALSYFDPVHGQIAYIADMGSSKKNKEIATLLYLMSIDDCTYHYESKQNINLTALLLQSFIKNDRSIDFKKLKKSIPLLASFLQDELQKFLNRMTVIFRSKECFINGHTLIFEDVVSGFIQYHQKENGSTGIFAEDALKKNAAFAKAILNYIDHYNNGFKNIINSETTSFEKRFTQKVFELINENDPNIKSIDDALLSRSNHIANATDARIKALLSLN